MACNPASSRRPASLPQPSYGTRSRCLGSRNRGHGAPSYPRAPRTAARCSPTAPPRVTLRRLTRSCRQLRARYAPRNQEDGTPPVAPEAPGTGVRATSRTSTPTPGSSSSTRTSRASSLPVLVRGGGASASLGLDPLAGPEPPDCLDDDVGCGPGRAGVPGFGERDDRLLDEFDAISRRICEAGLSMRAE
jgi:hypothetical protein